MRQEKYSYLRTNLSGNPRFSDKKFARSTKINER